MRMSLSWKILNMEGAAKKWGVGGRGMWIGLVLTYFKLLGASELFAEDDGRVYIEYCLREGLREGNVA